MTSTLMKAKARRGDNRHLVMRTARQRPTPSPQCLFYRHRLPSHGWRHFEDLSMKLSTT